MQKNTNQIHFLMLTKGEERYIFAYRNETVAELLRQFGRYASRQDVSFNWYDAATLAKEVKKVCENNYTQHK